MSLATNLQNLATRIATEFKGIRGLINGGGSSLSGLTTTDKTNLVAAINELVTAIGGAGASINDTAISALTVWSSSKTDAEIDAAVAALVNSAPGALDTLKEFADALANDPNFATTITNNLALKADKANPVFTGTVTVPDGTLTIANTSGLQTALNGKISAFADPNADRIVFWDDSASAFAALALSGLTISGTTMSLNAASESAAGIAEAATLAEVSTGTDTTRYVTAAGVRQEINTRAASSHTHTSASITDFSTAVPAAVPTASETVVGKVELATVAEALVGTDTVRAVTPAGVKGVADTKANTVHGHALTDANITGVLPFAQIPTGSTSSTVAVGNHTHSSAAITDFASAVDSRINVLVPAATVTAAGKVELATDLETATGTDISRAVTPASLRSITGDPETNLVAIFETALVS